MSDTVIRFDDVYKSYPSYNQITGGIKSFLFHLPQAIKELNSRRAALEGISFSIHKGEKFGFIGKNGAGKSTTLGLIAGVLTPDKGSVHINGRVSPLLELGAGFHPELSGRANILLNGVLMGLTKQEVLAHEQKIIEFAEIGEFIDQPVRTYSSGMYAKLGFAIVANLKPEILLLDEILAVGDIRFQQKCGKVFENFKNNPEITMILVSHALESVKQYCTRAAWIEDKKIMMIGSAKEVVDAYEKANSVKRPEEIFSSIPLHIQPGKLELDCSTGPCKFSPQIIPPTPQAQLRLTLVSPDNVPIHQWLIPVQPLIITYSNDTFSISPEDRCTLTEISCSCIINSDPLAPHLLSLSVEVGGSPQGPPLWLPLYLSTIACQKAQEQRAKVLRAAAGSGLPPFLWQGRGSVRIIARNIVINDAVGNFAIELAATLKRSGIPAQVYAYVSCAELAGIVAPIGALQKEVESSDILFYNYSTEDEFLPFLVEIPFNKKVLYYHNVTPGFWFKDSLPAFAAVLERAREQFTLFSHFDAVLANSHFSLNEISQYIANDAPTGVYPPTMNSNKFASLTPEPIALPNTRHYILWVGRIAPHKRPELALELFGKLCELRDDIAFLMVAGGRRDMPELSSQMEDKIQRLPNMVQERILWLEGLTNEQLAYVYRRATLFLCTSGHEGYCLPVKEALSVGLPVVAFAQPAVEETMNGRGVVLPEDIENATKELNILINKLQSQL